MAMLTSKAFDSVFAAEFVVFDTRIMPNLRPRQSIWSGGARHVRKHHPPHKVLNSPVNRYVFGRQWDNIETGWRRNCLPNTERMAIAGNYHGYHIVFAGSIGRSVKGGQAWANLQYLLGLQELGADITYLEDAGDWSVVYNWDKDEETDDLSYPANYIESCLRSTGFRGRQVYRTTDTFVGMASEELLETLESADLLIIRGIPFLTWRTEYDLPVKRIFIDVDPGFTQLRYDRGEPAFVETIDRCETLFSVGQRIAGGDSDVLTCSRTWHPTLPPVYLPGWPVQPQADGLPISSIMRWRGMSDLEHDGEKLGQKDREFPKFADIPQRTGRPFLAALTGGGNRLFEAGGWRTIPGWEASSSPEAYQEFIVNSAAEFGVAKHCYVATAGGWFSDRSVCYLASGRPIIVQNTGLEDWLLKDRGIHWYDTPYEAIEAVERVFDDMGNQSLYARRIAEDMFDTNRVLPYLLDRV
jgi:hypothetical protein